jgi:hypothetical protein
LASPSTTTEFEDSRMFKLSSPLARLPRRRARPFAGACWPRVPSRPPIRIRSTASWPAIIAAMPIARVMPSPSEGDAGFFGVKPTSTVVEIWPGGGWYTEVRAYLRGKGGYVAAFLPSR